MKTRPGFAIAFSLVLIVSFYIFSPGSAVAQTTCPAGKNTLTVNQTTSSTNGLDVLYNDMQGNMITIQSIHWKAELWFGYIEDGKSEHNLADSPTETEPLSGLVAITLTNLSSNEAYYSTMLMGGVGKVNACKDSKGEITVSFENLILTSKSEMQARMSGFAKYVPSH